MKKRLLAGLLCVCLLVGLLPTAAFAAGTGTGKAIQLGTSQIEGGQASIVYFGNYYQSDATGNTKEPVKWRVLSNTDGKLFLLSDQNLDAQLYNTSQTSITWEKSTIRSWLNGYGASENSYGTDYSVNNFIDAAFSSGEQGMIAETYVYNATQSDGNSNPNPIYPTSGGNNTTDKIFLLSIEEASNSSYFPSGDSSRISTNTVYAASGNTSMSGVGAANEWWLRSPGTNEEEGVPVEGVAAFVDDRGGVFNFGNLVYDTYYAVRPAFHLNLDSVLFTSAADGGKADAAVDGDLTAVGTAGTDWKLTLKDTSRSSFTANTATTTIEAGQSLSISYSGARTGSNEYVSVLLCDSSDNVLYYGRIAQNRESGMADITIPHELTAGNYTLKVFSEQYNGGKMTDYASDFVNISLTVTSDATAPKLTEGAATRSSESTATVTFTSDEAGTYYYAVVESGSAEPTVNTDGAGTACDTSEQTISLDNLTGMGEKDIYIVVKDAAGNESNKLKMTIPAVPRYSISASPETLNFGSEPEGYADAPAAQTVTVTNTGNQNVTVTLPSSAHYAITAGTGFTSNTASLTPGGTATFTVQPNTGLAEGSYHGTLSISGSDGASAGVALSFTVTHTHRYGTDWKTDADKHWHECSCGAKTDEADHVYDNEQDADCNVCGYVRTTYTLTVNLKGGSGSTVGGEYAEGAVIPINAGTRADYHFSGWASSNGGSFADVSSAGTTFTMPAADTTITANWQYDGKAIQIGTSQIEDGQASSVYFGNYQQSRNGSGGYNTDPVKWRVLANDENGSGTLFLLADQNLDVQPYNSSLTSITWENCSLRTWLNGTFLSAAFSNDEQGAVAQTYVYNATQSDGISNPNPSYNTSGGSDTTDQIFLLSIEEANNSGYFPNGNSSRISTNTAYVASHNGMGSAGRAGFWWLRSPGSYADNGANVQDSGSVYNYGNYVDGTTLAVRPAFNLNLNSVLFTSAASGGKADTAVDGDLTAVGTAGTDWKLTLKDDSRSSFTADPATTTIGAGQSLSIDYSGAQTGDNEYVSAMLAQGDTILYYGRIAQNSASGTASVTIPADLAPGSYTLYVFSEQYNGDYKTDYASAFKTVSLTVSNGATPPAITGVTVAPSTATVQAGGTQQFTASVTGTGAYDQTVTWSVTGAASTDTAIDTNGLLTVGANETATTLTITATANGDNTKSDTATVTVQTAPTPPTVTGVTVAPATATIRTGGTQQFTASVTGTGAYDQTVTWSVTGAASTSTAIDTNGLLTVGADETATTLTVTATANGDNTKSGTAAVTVETTPTPPTITGVSVTPATATVQTGDTQQFTASVTGTGAYDQTVIWSVAGAASSSTAIDTNGLLTVGADETAATLTVTATASGDNTKSGAATVTVETTPTPPTVTVTFDPNGQTATNMPAQRTGLAYGSKLTRPTDPTAVNTDYGFDGWYKDPGGTDPWDFDTDTLTAANVTLYAKWKQENFSISVTVYENNSTTVVSGATVKLMRGTNEIESAVTDNNGQFTFANHVSVGIYNIVATRTVNGEEQTKTELIEIVDHNVVDDIYMPPEGVSSTLTISKNTSAETPTVMVGRLDTEAETMFNKGTSVKKVTLGMAVEGKSETAAQGAAEIKQLVNSTDAAVSYLDVSIQAHIVTDSATTTETISKTQNVMEIIVEFQFNGRKNVKVYRYHEENGTGTAKEFTKATDRSNPADGTCWMDTQNNLIHIFSNQFSTLAISSEANTSYTLTLNANGGALAGNRTVVTETNGKLTSLPSAPTRQGYTFDGWYTAASGGEKVTTSTLFSKDTIIYAHWTQNSNSGSSGGGVSTYTVTVEDAAHGSIKADRTRAASGTTVTITVTPDSGYELDALTVTDSRGNELALTDKGGGKYTFRMPSGKVTVEASFAESGTEHNCPSLAFTDLNTAAWYHEAVDFVLENGMMGGYGNGLFGPNNTLSRSQLCQILYNLEGKPAIGPSSFTDVAADAWYSDAVAWANANGIVGGYPGNVFGPNDPITREQFAAILWRYARFKGYDVSIGEDTNILSYADAFDVSEYAIPAMQWACGAGVVGGYEDHTLRPQNTATRAQVAQMLMNFFVDMKKES